MRIDPVQVFAFGCVVSPVLARSLPEPVRSRPVALQPCGDCGVLDNLTARIGSATAFLLVENGQSLCRDRSLGELVEGSARRVVERHPPVPLEELASFLPASHGAAFLARAATLFPRGRVSDSIARAWRKELDPSWWLGVFGPRLATDPALDGFVRRGLVDALEQVGRDLAQKSRDTCGRFTFEHHYRDFDGNEGWHCWRARCQSHRCEHCASVLGLNEKERVHAQLLRDEEAGRAPCAFGTMTLIPSPDRSPVEAQILLARMARDFFEGLRARYDDPLQFTAPRREDPVAYHYVVEAHKSGSPHIHFLARGRGLADEMMRCGKRVRRKCTAAETAFWLLDHRPDETKARRVTRGRVLRALLTEERANPERTTTPGGNTPAYRTRELDRLADEEALRLVPTKQPPTHTYVVVNDPVADWSALCALVKQAKVRKKRTGHAACPFSALRHDLTALAEAAGFGAVFQIEPILSAEDIADYVTKSQVRPSVCGPVGDMAKTSQIPAVIPPHFRRFRSSGKKGDGKLSSFFMDEEREERDKPDTLDLMIVRAPVEERRAHYAAHGVPIVGEELEVDFRGVCPKGEKRKTTLGSFELGPVLRSSRPATMLAVVPYPRP